MRNIVPHDNSEVEYLKNENGRLNQDNERIANDRKVLEDIIKEKDNEIHNLSAAVDNSDAENQKKEIEHLKEDNVLLNERIEKEKKGKNLIEDELRRLIEELRNIS